VVAGEPALLTEGEFDALLVAYDVDSEGERGAERLAQLSSRMRRIRPLVGKDVTASGRLVGGCGIGCGSSWAGYSSCACGLTTRRTCAILVPPLRLSGARMPDAR
jgi:hypothetical protein